MYLVAVLDMDSMGLTSAVSFLGIQDIVLIPTVWVR